MHENKHLETRRRTSHRRSRVIRADSVFDRVWTAAPLQLCVTRVSWRLRRFANALVRAREGVEVGGVEPPSPEMLMGLLRAQPLGGFTRRQVNGTLSTSQPRKMSRWASRQCLPVSHPGCRTAQANSKPDAGVLLTMS